MKEIDLIWAGGEHQFALPIEQLRALQIKCDAGPEHILSRLTARQWYVEDVIETIRLGLIGGGMDKDEARGIVAKEIHDEPLSQFVLTARAIIAHALYGVEDDAVGESEAGEAKKKASSLAENGDSQDTTPVE